MALNAAVVLEVRTGGADTNGGGFKTGASGTDWSLQTGTQYAVADGVTAGTATITSATANFGTDVVGNLIYVQGGTGSITAGWYEITVRNSSLSITVDRSTGLTAGTGVTLNIGGALLSPGIAGAIATVAGITTYILNGTYSITSASTNIAAGCVSGTAGTMYIGYSASRTFGNTGTKPILQLSSVSSATIFAGAATINNLELDGATQTTAKWSSSTNINAYYCSMKNFTSASNGNVTGCYATGCTATAFSNTAWECVATANTATPFTGNCFSCISYSNTGGTTSGFTSSASAILINCSTYNNGNHGFNTASANVLWINCIAEGNTARGFNGVSTSTMMLNCATYNNTAGATNGIAQNINTFALSGSPFIAAGSANFALNNTASAGATCRAAGYPGVLQFGGTGYIDLGALQHADPAGAAGMLFIPSLDGV